MNAAQQARAHALFADALEQPPATLADWLRAQCAGDAEIEQRVLALLAADARTTGPLHAAAGEGCEVPRRLAGEREWTLLEPLGEGGMGTVWLAERQDSGFTLKAAVKLVRGELRLQPQALRRFENERRILAALKHPHIAALIDGGTLPGGAPFLVMEWVDGQRIDQWCSARQAGVETRLQLFLKVCAAVQAAHQQLVVHRDLKPGNILVTAAGEPKLLDFGIAKVLDAAADLSATGTGLAPMTLAYASPEQVRGAPAGVASDVYALGVVLYELLTGVRPFESTSDPVALARAVCEQAPEPPSRQATDPAASSSRTPPRHWRRRLRGDLDAIVLRALRKEPALRYGSVEQLAADVRRHLEGEPVLARRGTFGYRARKFLARHRYAAAAVTAVFFVLVVAVMVLATLLERARLERDKAERVTEFMVEMFDDSNPQDINRAGRDPLIAARRTVREAVDAAAPRVLTALSGSPEVQGTLLAAFARLYRGLGLAVEASRYGQLALERLQAAGRVPSTASVQARLFLVESLGSAQQLEAASEQAALAMAELDRIAPGPGFDRARALRIRGALHRSLGRLDEARRDAEAALDMFRATRGPNDPFVAGTRMDLAVVFAAAGNYPACVQSLDQAIAMVQPTLAREDLLLALMQGYRAECLAGLGDFDGAEQGFRTQLDAVVRVQGSESLDAAQSMNSLANLLNQAERPAEAAPLLREVLRIERRQLGEQHPRLAAPLLNLSAALFAMGEVDEAIALQMQSLALVPAELPQERAVALNNLGYKLLQLGRLDAAEPHLREAVALFAKLAPRHPDHAMAMNNLARLRLDAGDAAEARDWVGRALALRQAVLPAGHWSIADSRSLMGACLLALGKPDEARPLLVEGLAALRAALGPAHERTRRAQARLDKLEPHR